MDYKALSKNISFALRHAPEKFGLTLDEEGWVELSDLLNSLGKKAKWAHVTREDVEEIINTAAKQRFQLEGSRIRALYGHSGKNKVEKSPSKPPEKLFHGTPERNISSIKTNGIVPQSRQFVHLSIDEETAIQVAKRHAKDIVILTLDAARAWKEGVPFYEGNDKTWLADKIAWEYIEIESK